MALLALLAFWGWAESAKSANRAIGGKRVLSIALEATLRHSVAFCDQETRFGLEALGQFVVDGLLHPGEFIDG